VILTSSDIVKAHSGEIKVETKKTKERYSAFNYKKQMRKLLSVLALLTAAMVLTAQTEKTAEQLKKELAAHPQQDTFRVNRLYECMFNRDFTFEEQNKMAAEGLSIARKTGYRLGEVFALVNRGFCQSLLGNKIEGDSLLRFAGSFAKQLGNQELIGYFNLRVGQILMLNDDTKSLDYLKKAEQAFEKSGSYWLLARCQNSIASLYQLILSNYPLAMEYSLKTIRSAETANSPSRLIEGWMGLGSLYALLGDNNNAVVWLKKAETEINKGNYNNYTYYLLQNSLGEAYRLSEKYLEAIAAYKLAIKSSSPLIVAIIESNLADTYLRMDSLSLAFQYAFRSLPALKQSGDISNFGWIYEILGRAYLKKAMPDSAIWYAHAGLDSSIKSGTIEYMRDNTKALANAYAFKKDFAKAYTYHLQYINYRDSMLNTEIKNKTALYQYNNDLGKKEVQITQLNLEKKGQKNFLISVFVVLGLIVVSAIGMLRNIRQKRKANKLLQQQKKEIDGKARELSVQKENLQQSYNNVEQLGEIGRKITSSLSVEKIISTVYDNVNTLMEAAVFGIGIYDDTLKRIDFPATHEDGLALPFYSTSADDKSRFAAICFREGKEIVMGNLDEEHRLHIQEVATPHEGKQPVSLIYLPLVIKEKILGVITVQSFQLNAYSDYHIFMLRAIAIYTAIALENAESFNTLNQTVVRLKATQAQLIQSEKMASLGELTAGIAHEIQNPLNFVNNFSEVNRELLVEMKDEMDKGHLDDAKVLANDVIDNEEKIIYHGKRAEAIVKGMLQHSRSNSGVKEPTNINALADEYLRLAYHGLRAKDKSFNALMKTDYDESIGNINIIPQDIGRVILNLITNAFYVVNEKALLAVVTPAAVKYEPTVSVATKKVADKVLISVKDNGNGIPQKIVDKIFQPFFTTKPTGQGTGLGLSLAYDIVKAHGGELKVETKEGEGSEFIISLPL